MLQNSSKSLWLTILAYFQPIFECLLLGTKNCIDGHRDKTPGAFQMSKKGLHPFTDRKGQELNETRSHTRRADIADLKAAARTKSRRLFFVPEIRPARSQILLVHPGQCIVDWRTIAPNVYWVFIYLAQKTVQIGTRAKHPAPSRKR